MATSVLYTPEVLGLAAELSRFRLDDSIKPVAEAKSRTCGSSIVLGLSYSGGGMIDHAGVRSQACAIGQAAAAIFAKGVSGMTPDQVRLSRDAIAEWLDRGGSVPHWPGLEAIAAVQEHKGRHGAVMLAWNAACELLSTTDAYR